MDSNEKWKKQNTILVPIRFNRNTDTEIVEWIEKLKSEKISVSGEIKKAILEYLNAHD